jgi:hypothetical protein
VLWDSFGQSWSLHDIALFEAAFALYSKDFEAIQRVVSSKTTREIVHFFYLWKMTSHYRVYKVKAAVKADRAKAAAMAAAMAAATAAAGKKVVTSKHPLSTYWGNSKKSKGKKRQAPSTSSKGGGRGGGGGGGGGGQGPKKKAKKKQKKKQTKAKRIIGGGPIMSDGKPIAKLLGVPLYPGDLLRAVETQGGIDVVRKKRIWQAVRKVMKLKKTSSSGHTLNTAYKRYALIGAFDATMMQPAVERNDDEAAVQGSSSTSAAAAADNDAGVDGAAGSSGEASGKQTKENTGYADAEEEEDAKEKDSEEPEQPAEGSGPEALKE